MFHLGFVYTRSVIPYEKLDFYDCGFAAFPPVSQSSCGWRPASAAALARVALFSWATFTGGLLDCPGTLAGHKLTPRLGRVVCSSPGLNRSFESPLSGRWVRFCDTKADVAKWSSHTFPRHHNFPRILKKKKSIFLHGNTQIHTQNVSGQGIHMIQHAENPQLEKNVITSCADCESHQIHRRKRRRRK